MSPPEPDLPPASPRPAQYWTVQERWVWDRTLAGEVADFNVLYEALLDPKQDDVRWSDEKPRLVSEKFLLDVLGRKRYLEAIPPRGLNIVGARFGSNLRLMTLVVDCGVGLMRSRFEGAVDLASARFDKGWSFAGSAFNQVLNMTGLMVGQNLFLGAGASFAGDVVLVGAKVDKQLRASEATFKVGLNMNSLMVGQHLLLDNTRFKGDVVLVGAKVDKQLGASDATFEAGLNMDSLTVGQHLLLDNTRFKGDVVLVGAKVHGSIDTSRATFEAGLNMDSLAVGQNLFLGGATFRAPVDASGLTITGRLRLHPPPAWGDGARFVLRNAQIGALDDGGAATENPWPGRGKLELDGFSYGRLVLPRTAHWYIDQWLACDTSYTPQPYQHLAGMLRAHGDPSGANDVLYAARERERTEAGKQSLAGPKRLKAALHWFGLSLLNWTIGYGLGGRYFRVLIWLFGLALIGALVLCPSAADRIAGIEQPGDMGATEVLLSSTKLYPTAELLLLSFESENRTGFNWCLWASFDWTLPLIELDTKHASTIAQLGGGPFYWFYVQALLGYVLAGFLAAGLAGLTQSRG